MTFRHRPIRLPHRHAAASLLLIALHLAAAGCTPQRRGTPGAQAALAAGTAPTAPAPPAPPAPPGTSAQVVPGNTGIVGPGGSPVPASSTSASASSSATTTNPRQLYEKGRAIAAKLRSGEKTPQTLTADERDTLVKIEALRRQQRKQRD